MRRFFFSLIFSALLYMLLTFLFSSCAAPKVVYVPVVKDSIQTRTEVRVDSVWRDRVRTEYVKGDTVRILDSVIVQSFQYRDRADTVIVRDSIPVLRDVPGPVVYKRTDYDKFCSRAFWSIVIFALLVIVLYFTKKYYFRM